MSSIKLEPLSEKLTQQISSELKDDEIEKELIILIQLAIIEFLDVYANSKYSNTDRRIWVWLPEHEFALAEISEHSPHILTKDQTRRIMSHEKESSGFMRILECCLDASDFNDFRFGTIQRIISSLLVHTNAAFQRNIDWLRKHVTEQSEQKKTEDFLGLLGDSEYWKRQPRLEVQTTNKQMDGDLGALANKPYFYLCADHYFESLCNVMDKFLLQVSSSKRLQSRARLLLSKLKAW